MTEFKPEDVTYLDDVMALLKVKLNEAGMAAQTKVLPGARAKVMAPLREANVLLGSATEVLMRSGMGKKLGFVKNQSGIQPVMGTDLPKTDGDSPVNGE